MTRPAPYPADTKAKGWRFELDLERVEQSDTWDLAAEIPMAQHALLMMWTTAWRQVPCGSMPADTNLIRAKLKIPPKLWAPMAAVVMRGWWPAEDGRLYHNAIIERVLEMMQRDQVFFDLKNGTGYRRHLDAVIAAHGSVCFYCGTNLDSPTLDHVIPRCQGGSDDPINLVPACKSCNSSKGGRTPDQWRSCNGR